MAEKIDAEALQFGQMLQGYREQAKITQQDIADCSLRSAWRAVFLWLVFSEM